MIKGISNDKRQSKMIKEQNYNMLKNHNDLKTVFTKISKKPAPSQILQDRTSKISRTDEYFEADESGILIVNEK